MCGGGGGRLSVNVTNQNVTVIREIPGSVINPVY